MSCARYIRSYKQLQGFTLFELILVIAIVSVLVGVFLERFVSYQELAEKTAMEQVVGTVQSALVLQFAQIQTRGQASDVAAMVIDNPMRYLQKKPRNYAGEFYGATPSSAESGNWIFDLKSREMIYLVQHKEHFQSGKDGNDWIRFRVTLQYEEPLSGNQRDTENELVGIVFEPVQGYHWKS